MTYSNIIFVINLEGDYRNIIYYRIEIMHPDFKWDIIDEKEYSIISITKFDHQDS